MQIDESAINLKTYSKILDSVVTELENIGFLVEKKDNEIIATKHIDYIFALSSWDTLLKPDEQAIFTSKNNLFTKEYELNANIDLTGYSKTAKEINLDKELKELIDIEFNLTLPSKAQENNATVVSGKNLSWKLNYGEVNEIYAKYEILDTGTMVALCASIMLFVAIFIVFLKNKNKNEININV
jgi:hypothetical protein